MSTVATEEHGGGVGTDEEFVLNGAKRCVRKATSTGLRCKNPAVNGTTVCRKHGGTAKQIRTAVRRREQEDTLKRTMAALDLNALPSVSPQEALLSQVALCSRMVAWHTELISRLEPDEVTPGLMVTRYTDDKGREQTATQHVLVKSLGEWSDRLTRTTKAALDADVAKYQVHQEMDEQVEMIRTAIRLTLRKFGLDVYDKEIADAFTAAIKTAERSRHGT